MANLITWDATGEHFYETGVKQCVLYVYDSTVTTAGQQYKPGVAWNGVTAITESPSGAEANAMYADDQKYLNLYSAEEFGATIEAYTYPDEFGQCDGSADLIAGVKIGQQERKTFGLCYRTTVGNDSDGNEYGYKLHLVYGLKASPSERAYQTINDSPEAITFSWELSSIPVSVSDIGTTSYKSTSCLTIDTTKLSATAKANLTTLESKLYGTAAEGSTEAVDAYLPLPNEVYTILNNSTTTTTTDGDDE